MPGPPYPYPCPRYKTALNQNPKPQPPRYKTALKQAYGWYNWTVASLALGDQVLMASTPSKPVPRLLALHPRLAAELLSIRSFASLRRWGRGGVRWALLPRWYAWPGG